jgi:hypothetical protein
MSLWNKFDAWCVSRATERDAKRGLLLLRWLMWSLGLSKWLAASPMIVLLALPVVAMFLAPNTTTGYAFYFCLLLLVFPTPRAITRAREMAEAKLSRGAAEADKEDPP